jgi:hypothetical protein
MLNAIGEPVHYDLIQMLGAVKHDPFWDYIDEHNLTIGKPQAKTPIYDDINKVERGMTNDEYYEFIKKSGQEIKRRVTEEIMTKNLSEDDIQKGVLNIKTEVRNKFRTELFGWGQLRHDHESDWMLMKNNDALQIPRNSVKITIGKEKIRFGEEKGVPSKELEDFNNIAIEEYRKKVIKYLRNSDAVKANKTKIDPITEVSKFDEKMNEIWIESIKTAKSKKEKQLKEQKK